MKQSRTASLIEVLSSIAVGFVVSMIVQTFVAKMWGFPLTFVDNLGITLIFTVTSIIRGYLFRRLFEYLRVRELLK